MEETRASNRRTDEVIDCGIYSITNTVTGHVYIGLSHRIRSRWQEHRSTLRNGLHRNSQMQADFNEFGINSFQFEVIHPIDRGMDRSDMERIERQAYQSQRVSGALLYNSPTGFFHGHSDGKPKKPTGFRLTQPALDALAGIAEHYGVSHTAALEITLRAQWRRIQGESANTTTARVEDREPVASENGSN